MNINFIKSPIARHFVLYIVLFSSLITLVTTAIQLYRAYDSDLKIIHTELEQVEVVHLETLTEALWALNEEALQTNIEGILNLRDIEFVEIRDEKRILVASTGKKNGQNIIQREYPITHSFLDKKKNIGSLTVIASLDSVYRRVMDTVWVILISNALKTFLVAIFIYFLFYRLVARHISRVAEFSAGLEINNLEKTFEYDRQENISGNEDELDALRNALLKMQQNLGNATRLAKQREITLRNSEQRFQDFAESSSDWFWEMDTDLNFTYASSRFFELTGFNSEDIYGQSRKVLINGKLEDIKDGKWRQHFLQMKNKKSFRNFDYQIMKRDGEIISVSLNGTPTYSSGGKFIGYRGTGADITKRKQAEQLLNYQASHDALTGLTSRYEFELRVTRLLSTIQFNPDHIEHAMCFLDLDQFKVINDTCGHSAGDELLRQLGKILKSTVRQRDTLARLGGDEFGVLMEHCSLDQAHRVASEMLRAIMDYQFFWEGNTFRIGVSIGLVAITEANSSFNNLFKQADAACYMAKDLGRNRVHVYLSEDTELALRHGEMQWVARINNALATNRFRLYAQRIMPLDNSSDKHYELLLRMIDERGEIILPGAFLSAAERYDLIGKLDDWVVGHALAIMASHPEFVEQTHFLSINLSGQSVTNADFVDSVISQIRESGIDPGKICFEITETAAISNLAAASTFISTLRDLGCRFALDDFGSGLSSFGYLKNLPIDYLKIDGMFVKDMVEDPIDRAMVKSINEIGHVMGMKTIAEFVENEEIMSLLVDTGIDYAQGYEVGKPEPLSKLIDNCLKAQILLSRTSNPSSL